MSKSVRESEIKNRIRQEFFFAYDWTRAVGNIDLTVCSQPVIGSPQVTYLWCETKQGSKHDIIESFIQLILTVGKERTYESELPPYFLGAADAEKIAFVDYSKVMHIFTKNDFNWNVTPSDHGTKEFKELYSLLHDDLQKDIVIFKFAFDDRTLRQFIRKNFREGRSEAAKISVGKNNFTFVYYDWVRSVKDSIAVDWKALEKAGVLDCDFFLADLMSKDGMSIKDKLKVVLEKTKYKVLVKADLGGIFGDAFQEFSFRDGQKAYNQFWNRYERPPKPIYQRYILERRDLLVPQDIREIKGSYYTPEQWVRLSQEYLAKALGEDWQEEYYVWDCAAGSGNLLRGLTNKYNIYASTLDDSDVKVMHDAIDGGRLNLVKSNVFQFDFLNDGYVKGSDGSWVSDLENCKKIPESLRNIIKDPVKRCKLAIYINAPYKEATNARTVTSTGQNQAGVSIGTVVADKYKNEISSGINELYAQFVYRVSQEIPSCVLAEFSTLKILQGPNFSEFRKRMNMELRSMFVVPGNTFDNVTGDFPIGFKIWFTGHNVSFESIESDVFIYQNGSVEKLNGRSFYNYDNHKLISSWIRQFDSKDDSNRISYLCTAPPDFQHCKYVRIESSFPNMHALIPRIVSDNLLACSVYNAVRNIPDATWLNDRDQFLAPKDSWAGDIVFQTDCLVWSIFNNAVHEENGVCHWIPFYEDEVNSPAPFNSRFMADFLHGRIKRNATEVQGDLFEQQAAAEAAQAVPFDNLSAEAKAVLDAGKEIWKYYMQQPGINANASFLDIRAFFQGYSTGKDAKRKMNSSSADSHYMVLWADLKDKMRKLEAHIEPKIYEHGFLLK